MAEKDIIKKTFEDDDGYSSKEDKDFLKEVGLTEMYSPLCSEIKSKFDEADRARQEPERQWLRNLNSFRGRDTSGSLLRNSEQSKVFLRTTSVKVKAGYGQVIETTLAESYPISVSSTHIPEGVSEYAHLMTDMQPQQSGPVAEEPQGPLAGIGFEGDGFQVAPGSTYDNLHFLGGMQEEFSDEEGNTVLMEGKSMDPSMAQISPAKELARRMQKTIYDQLDETKAKTEFRKTAFEMCLLGTGVIKGPFNYNKTLHLWEDDPEGGDRIYSPETVVRPRINMTSIWNIYPDPTARSPEELEWVIERHKMNRSQLRSLQDRPHFKMDALNRLLARPTGNYERKSFEHTLDENTVIEADSRLYEVLEYWGFMDKAMLEEYNLPTNELLDKNSQVQVNVWVCGNEVLRVVVNPFIPQRIPYFIIPYEMDPYSIWGTGIPESMEDSQAMMNGFTRLAVDNLALAGNLVFDIDESMLVPGQPMEISPGQIFRRQAGSPGRAVYGINFPNTAPANMQMFKEFRQMADESTGIPSFAHGQTGVMSPTRTASGMSMLLQNASLSTKTVIRNLDDFLFKPLGEAYYRWNMQFNPDVRIRGDLEVKATGSSSLQAKEIRSQRLTSFLQMAANPALAPLIKLPTVLKEFAITMDIDPDEILNSPEEAEIYARLMGTQNMQHPDQMGADPQAMMAGSPPSPNDPQYTGNDLSSGGAMMAQQAMMEGGM